MRARVTRGFADVCLREETFRGEHGCFCLLLIVPRLADPSGTEVVGGNSRTRGEAVTSLQLDGVTTVREDEFDCDSAFFEVEFDLPE